MNTTIQQYVHNLQIDITHECNFRCPSCNRLCDKIKYGNETRMTIAEFDDVLNQAAECGICSIDIMGGEPTLNPDLFMMCEHAKQMFTKVNILSNGSNNELLAELSEKYNVNIVNKDGNNESEARLNKSQKHINIYDDRNFTLLNKLHDCYTVKKCGALAYKNTNRKIVYMFCSCTMYIAKLLGLESQYGKTTLKEALNME